MSRVYDLTDLFRKRLGRMRRCKPSCLDLVLIPQLQKSINTNGRTENAARDICGVGWRSILGVEPGTDVSESRG